MFSRELSSQTRKDLNNAAKLNSKVKKFLKGGIQKLLNF